MYLSLGKQLIEQVSAGQLPISLGTLGPFHSGAYMASFVSFLCSSDRKDPPYQLRKCDAITLIDCVGRQISKLVLANSALVLLMAQINFQAFPSHL